MTTKDAKPKRTRTRKPKEEPPAPSETPASATPSPAVPGADAVPVAAPPVEPAAAPTAASAPAQMSLEERELRWSELGQVVVFRLEGQRYALPIECVQEIQQIVAISEVPGSAGAVLGVINLRGVVIPAIDMRVLLDLPYREADLETPMVLAYTSQGLVSLLVDEVEDVLEVSPASMQAPSAVHALADRLLGVCTLDEGLLFVFDMDRLILPEAVSGVVA